MTTTTATKLIGLMAGGGTGTELINAVLPCFKAVEELYDIKFNFLHFDNEKWRKEAETEVWHQPFYEAMCDFYEQVEQLGGCILRGAVQAPVLYKARERVNHNYKINPIKGIPEISDLTRFSPQELDDLEIFLVRQNTFGLFHCDGEYNGIGKAVVEITHHREDVERLADYSFKLAKGGSLTLAMPTRKLGAIGELWEKVFEEKAAAHPNINYWRIEPCIEDIAHYVRTRKNFDTASDPYDLPMKQYNVIVGPELFMDYMMDDVAWAIHGEPSIACSGNFSPDGFSSFQTNHGTVTPIADKDIVNPIAMVHAVAMCLEYYYQLPEAAKSLELAVRKTLAAGYRTPDLHRGNTRYQKVGTKAMVEKIIDELKTL
ncbi:isocitrate/isopropylmalate family dehydrogenase [Moorena producens]|uniref:isocitrate/isopropylmalate family dehydrogenase n=1 Tax=Moorena producens TaxID=1155739 RepID=UPI003C75086B